jgi:hypothetical protein
MIMGIDTSLLIAAGASFMAGLIGYIIARLWIVPILRYTAARRRLDRDLRRYQTQVSQQLSPAANHRHQRHKADDVALSARRHAMQLVSCYTKEIPYWYRLLLDSRQESPSEASGLLTNISKMKDGQQIIDRILKARRAIGLK